MIDRPPPLWVRALARVLPWMPVGRYWLVHQLRRFAVPPFVMRLPPEPRRVCLPLRSRDSVAREVCFTGCYEPQETQLASRLLHAGDVFVDVGANWGYFTLAGAHWVGAGGRVIAFEPEPRLFALLTSNLEANRLDFVKAYRTAAAAGSGRHRLHGISCRQRQLGAVAIDRRGAPADFDCETVALDDALDAAGIGTVQLTKIDVEGGEADVLTGMARGLAQGRYRYVLMECHPDAARRAGR